VVTVRRFTVSVCVFIIVGIENVVEDVTPGSALETLWKLFTPGRLVVEHTGIDAVQARFDRAMVPDQLHRELPAQIPGARIVASVLVMPRDAPVIGSRQ
tara:strand:+ start:224 stop:520 length:297 start_codon:yes stop_codon:yes gene_type:complete